MTAAANVRLTVLEPHGFVPGHVIALRSGLYRVVAARDTELELELIRGFDLFLWRIGTWAAEIRYRAGRAWSYLMRGA